MKLEFSKMLSGLLSATKTKQNELAKAIGCAQGIVSDYKNGKIEPTAKMVLKLANYFGITTDELLTGKKPSLKGMNAISLDGLTQRQKDKVEAKIESYLELNEEMADHRRQPEEEAGAVAEKLAG